MTIFEIILLITNIIAWVAWYRASQGWGRALELAENGAHLAASFEAELCLLKSKLREHEGSFEQDGEQMLSPWNYYWYWWMLYADALDASRLFIPDEVQRWKDLRDPKPYK